jgi:hypothetical protein
MLDGERPRRYVPGVSSLADMRASPVFQWFCCAGMLAMLPGCAPMRSTDGAAAGAAAAPVAANTIVAAVDGFSGPEAVRYDPDQDVYFVANFNGPGGAIDTNGFISRIRPDGSVEQLRFIAGGVNGVEIFQLPG